MARLRNSHPWTAGYALPKNVLDEPYGRGVLVTKQAKRGTIAALQPEWLVGGPGAGGDQSRAVIGTLKGRGTTLQRNTLSGNIFQSSGLGSLSGSSLDATGTGGAPANPITTFGQEGARVVLEELALLPEGKRALALKDILNAIDHGLYPKVRANIATLQGQGLAPQAAMQRALAAALSARYVEQLKTLGQTKQIPTSGVLGLGLGGVDPEGLGGILDKIWGGIKTAGGAVGGVASKVGSKLGSLACKASTNPGVVAAAAASGGPAGASGAAFAKDLCSGNKPAEAGQQIVYQAPPFPMLPVLAIGGGLLLVLALRK